jgi:TRAP-type mannitol/chloroaromatic compound transport system permease small subunit
MSRFINGLLDLVSIFFVGKFGKRPMHFFGTMGVLSFLTGFIIAVWMLSQKLYDISHHIKITRDVTAQPLFYIALVAIIVGSQLFLTGFVAELVSRSSHDRNNYQVAETI